MEKLVWWIGLFFYITILAKRHTKLLRILLYLIIVYFVAGFIWGSIITDIVFAALRLGLQLAFAMAFMAFQFLGIFWLMSQTRVTIVRPGDVEILVSISVYLIVRLFPYLSQVIFLENKFTRY